MTPPIRPPDAVKRLLDRLHRAGYEAYVVGGCVRDSLLGQTPKDWDVTTAATPDTVLRLFADCPCFTAGKRLGTVGVVMDSLPIEVTAFRRESGYSDSRHPDTVTFVTDIREDLRRRDFTVNAMAYTAESGLIDPFGGQADLQNRQLRCVGDPRRRFSEDALRLLRGVRFAATLGFSVEPCTAAALHGERKRLRDIAAERVSAELIKLVCGGYLPPILTDYADLLATVLPQAAPSANATAAVWADYRHTLHAMAASPADLVVRFSLLLRGCGAVAAQEALTRLRLDTRTVQSVTALIRCEDTALSAEPAAVRHMVNRLGVPLYRQWLAVRRADGATQADEAERCLNALLAEHACFSLKELAVNGHDLQALGLSPGPAVGKTLHRLLNAVLDGRCPNRRENLLKLALSPENEESV